MMKIFCATITMMSLFLFLVSDAFAHVVVRPNQANIGAFQTFTVGVPNEKDVAVTGLRLLIPEGLQHVSPNVKPGWTVRIIKDGAGEDAKVTEVTWTGGSIPSGQRDDFLFSAQVPASETILSWKAYQTYQGGLVVSWDQAPVAKQTDAEREMMEEKNLGPFSQTKVINDLTTPPPQNESGVTQNTKAITFSLVAVALSICALVMQFSKKKR